MKINFIFDFDGTLVDSFHSVIEKFNLLAGEFNFRYIDDSEVNELRNLTSKELMRYLKIPIYKIPAILVKARALMHAEMKKLPPFTNLRETIKEMRETNVNLGILTSNSSENVIAWLRHYDMQDFFNFIHVESNYFGKKRILKKMIKTYQMDQSRTFYIGDETRDIEAAKACHINSIAVTWGFSSEKVLLQHQPHFIARAPADMLAILEKTNGL